MAALDSQMIEILKRRVRRGVAFLDGCNMDWRDQVRRPIDVDSHCDGLVEQATGLSTAVFMIEYEIDFGQMVELGFAEDWPLTPGVREFFNGLLENAKDRLPL